MKISLLGDSIRLIGYGKKLPELLGRGVEIYQPDENCRFAKHTLRGLFDWKNDLAGSDVIHWNNGLWDTCTLFGADEPFTPLDEYVNTMVRIGKQLLQITPHVIFATTTPVLEGHSSNKTERIIEYNRAVVPKLRELGIRINDLFGVISADPGKYIRSDDKIHLTDLGIEVAAKEIARHIREIAPDKLAESRSINKNVDKGGVLILTDLEGISGVSTIDAIPADSPLYREACENLMKDTNTAISALFDSGADTVYVNDGHGSGNNFIKDMLDKRAVQVTLAELSDIIQSISSVVLIGMHAMSGTANAFLDHTQSSARIHRYYYNGHRIGEMSQIGAFAGYFGVPCVAVSGDESACREAKRIFPCISTAAVKTARGRNSADCIDAKTAQKRIYDAVCDGYLHRAEAKPHSVKLPLNVDVEFHRADYCDEALAKHPELIRIDEFTVRSVKTEIKDYLDVLILWG